VTKQEYMKFHEEFCQKMIEITKAKNHDYAGAVDDPFNNFRHIGNLVGDVAGNVSGTGPLDIVAVGFLTRMSDKFSRIGSFIAKGELKVKDESVADTLLDLANYSALFAGYLKEQAAKKSTQSTKLPTNHGHLVAEAEE